MLADGEVGGPEDEVVQILCEVDNVGSYHGPCETVSNSLQCLLVFTYAYTCLPSFIHVYLCLPMFTRV